MLAGLPLVALWVAVLVFGVGFFVRAAAYFGTEKKQKNDMIAVLQEIRDALRKA